jgi:hypothetical protein
VSVTEAIEDKKSTTVDNEVKQNIFAKNVVD